MGTPGKDFYNRLARRYGYVGPTAEIEKLYRRGGKAAAAGAAAAVPRKLLRTVSLAGPPGHVAERAAALRTSGVSASNAAPLAPSVGRRVNDIAALKGIVS